ncbi:MAG: hypothetical protein JW751_11405 [Polyangiaceae bacterium]|nr:hypothetical protein [Polyangiaceae bacterium]
MMGFLDPARPVPPAWNGAVQGAAAVASGFLLAASTEPIRAWFLSAIAWIPLYAVLVRVRPGWWQTLRLGLLSGAAYCVPLLVSLGFPWLLTVALAGWQILLWCLALCWVRRCLVMPPLAASLAAGAAAAIVEWASFTIAPVWGTAQCFARVWSAAPWASQIVSVTGITGLVFVLLAGQLYAAVILVTPEHRGRRALGLLSAVALYAGVGIVVSRAEPERRLRVAAWGWSETENPQESLPIEARYARAAEEASRAGARLLVFPEAVFDVTVGSRSAARVRWGELAQRYGLTLVVGYFDRSERQNLALMLSPDPGNESRPAYSKTHLIPFIESYTPGDGTLAETQVDGVNVGAMICQDDNFTDLARGYGRRGTSIVVVPTNDWQSVARVHLENSRLRTIENGYGLVRAAHNGISAIVSPRGALLAERDHFREGPGLVVADLPVGEGHTVFARWGSFVPLLWGSVLGLLEWHHRRRRRGGIAACSGAP